MNTAWHELAPDMAVQRLESDLIAGLSSSEVIDRQARHGSNELIDQGGRSLGRIVWNQLRGPMVALLAVAAIVSFALGEPRDAVAILIIVVLNATLGVVQEYRAERAMAALKRLEVPRVKVQRDGRLLILPAPELVPGDIVLLEAGDRVPADARLVETADLRTHEAALTGEAEAVLKDTASVSAIDAPLGDRRGMVYMGTLVVSGRGRALVTTIGMRTELGRIADLLQTVEDQSSPLERRLGQLGRGLALAALGIVAAVWLLGWLRGEPWHLLILTGLSLAVAAVPEGLPAVATVALALGARRMLARRALVRRLPAVETLGSVTVICADKTGTLTRNRMTVAALETVDAQIDTLDRDEFGDCANESTLAALLGGMALCNDAMPPNLDDGTDDVTVGEPTEVALVEAAARCGFGKQELETRLPRCAEAAFDATRKRMTTIHELPACSADAAKGSSTDAWLAWSARGGTRYVAVVKGAVDVLLERADRIWYGDGPRALDATERARVIAAHDRLAGRGMRMLCVAFRPLDQLPAAIELVETELVFVGLVGLIDPPRRGVAQAIARCQQAGIRPMMITGDHPLTALAIAKSLGISRRGSSLTGRQLEGMSEQALADVVDEVEVFARVAPEHKLSIVQALQDRGHIVAMTGDGVNDAPALRQADIGLAMGVGGTDVAKEAAEMVLLDDHFATIVDAVEEGRTIYGNVRKFVRFILASNMGEVWVMLVAPILGMPLPLLPLQILWINLVTDGLPGLALSVEAGEPGTMRRPPYPPGESIFRRGLGRDVLWIGMLIGSLALTVGYLRWRSAADESLDWRTMVFTILTLSQVTIALALRSRTASALAWRGNPALLAAVVSTFGLQMAALYWPPLASVLGVTALGPQDLMLCLGLSIVPFTAIEAHKRWWARAHPDAR